MISKLLLLILANIALFIWQLHLGSVEVSLSDWKAFLLGDASPELDIILGEIRIPRVMTSGCRDCFEFGWFYDAGEV